MILSVDRIKDSILICEDINSGNLYTIKPSKKIAEIKEGSIKDHTVYLKGRIVWCKLYVNKIVIKRVEEQNISERK